jgi:Protein of unknown function (DUF3551)
MTFEVRIVEEVSMRKIALTLLAVGGLWMLHGSPAQAYGFRHAFCIQGDEYPGLSGCSFDSYGQCMATASGRFLTCIANPYYLGPSDDPYAYRNRNRPFRGYSYQPY